MVERLLAEELHLEKYELAIEFVSAKKMASLNEQFLAHKGSTDVITFDYREGYGRLGEEREDDEALELAGEIFISVADAIEQSGQFSTTWQEELIRYAVHGILHLLGHDDLDPEKRKRMKREENRLVRQLTARFEPRKVAA